ncbi:unnamed protein product [Didymodactylos carnosus]|uniref:Uncharacterized protein n=1 Tax=Didymodactylos carnosus TaxID=1234261 RepID=A0A8S2DN71_9BILA|nr:unnamed protein product [Didymodactylos carnosus]CAF3735059.1 unnamed protein product [Didymodactylos carnosus]
MLLNGYVNSGCRRQFVLDNDRQIIVHPWQNMTDIHWPIIVSSWDVSSNQLELRWHWYPPKSINDHNFMTQPTMDERGTTYLVSMPSAFSINSNGQTLWISELATNDEMRQFELISICLSVNLRARVMYAVIGSPLYHEGDSLYFISALNMDNGNVLKRYELNIDSKSKITPHCPILIGSDMFYFFWLTGEYPDLVPLKVSGVPQIKL